MAKKPPVRMIPKDTCYEIDGEKFIATEDMVLVDQKWMEEAEAIDAMLDPEGHAAAMARDAKVIRSGKLAGNSH
jgi:hypothetical protein